jgi:hypothetical protein
MHDLLATNWGDVASWVAVAVTFVMAAAGLVWQWWTRRRSQAEQIAVWRSQDHVLSLDPPSEFEWWLGFVCWNQSTGPVSEMVFWTDADRVRDLGILEHGGELGPGERFEGRLRCQHGPVPRIGYDFTDAAGRRWRRNPNGSMSRVKDYRGPSVEWSVRGEDDQQPQPRPRRRLGRT